jgi:mannose-6-phosphate isomerase class I
MTYEIDDPICTESLQSDLRKSSQRLMPSKLNNHPHEFGKYTIYPTSSLGEGKIFDGFDSLAEFIIEQGNAVIDGYAGIFWSNIKDGLQKYFTEVGLTVNWVDANLFMKSETTINELIAPFLGAENSVWGTRTTLALADLFETSIAQQKPLSNAINIVFGTGAALSNWNAALIYIDLPKNELQFRMRAGSITNLGASQPQTAFAMYKRFYFVDWVMLNNYKKELLERINVVADGQWPSTINWCLKKELLQGLKQLSQSVIRVRPWFEPGAWGGQWLKENIKGLNQDAVNLAWSFELIVPENGLVFESDGNLLEVSFDTLMFAYGQNILGEHAEKFGMEFPIRFDFLDTFKGGNLSIQCHPKLAYIQENFGEKLTQDETYYILDCEKEAKVFLGFQEQIDPIAYRRALEDSQATGQEIEIEHYVQSHQAKKHDLFLIPNGTVHSAGSGNLVLEISATPYIFTFKMYDWVRLDLDGKPRPINIEHAFNNLDFELKGERVANELISKPVVIEESANCELIHLPTTAAHFYDVHRIEFDGTVAIATANCCHVLMIVEGSGLLLETADGTKQEFAFAETFVIPAAAHSYTLTNLGQSRIKVVKAFLK